MYNRKIQDKQNDVVCTLFLFCLLLIVCILKHLKLLTKVLIKSQNVGQIVFQLTQLAIQNSLNRKKSLEKLSQLCI